MVVSLALLASLLEVLLVLPSHLTDIITPAYARKVRSHERAWLSRARRAYGSLLATAMRWRYVTISLLLCLTILLSATALNKIPFV